MTKTRDKKREQNPEEMETSFVYDSNTNTIISCQTITIRTPIFDVESDLQYFPDG